MKKRHRPLADCDRDSLAVSRSIAIPDRIRPWASLWLVVHLFTVCLALSANLIPSELQLRLLGAVGFYASTINQAYGLLPFEMVQGSEHDHLFAFQVHVANSAGDQWQSVLPPSITSPAKTNHAWKRFMRLSGMLAVQEEHAIVTKLCEAATRSFEDQHSATVDSVRMVRQIVPSFEQDLLIAQGQQEIIARELEDEVLYQARIVRFPDGRLAFVPETSSTRAARTRVGNAHPTQEPVSPRP